MLDFNTVLVCSCALFLVAICGLGWDWYVRIQAEDRKRKAKWILKEHGLHTSTYVASFGCAIGDLRSALEEFDYSNEVVLDRHGRLVGLVLPVTIARKPKMQLVVDNTKNKRTEGWPEC